MRGSRGLFRFLALYAVLAFVTACAGAGPTAAPTATPTAAPTAAITPAPATPTAQPATPEPATPEPTPASVTPEPATPEPTDEAVAPEALLISYVHPDLRATCQVRDQIYDSEVVSITCGAVDLPFDLSLFHSVADMGAAYLDDVAGAETPPTTNGTCPEGNYEGPYGTNNTPLGRLNCREHTSSAGDPYHVLEWTNDELMVIGYISNRTDLHTWQELIAFRAANAGPFPPD